MMASMDVLNDDCFYEVFNWLTLQEKCAVQRVKRQWKRVNEDMITLEDTLELVVRYPKNNNPVDDHPNAYYSKELEVLFETGMLNDVVKGFFKKFAKKQETSESDLVISKIHHLAIIGNFKEEQQEDEKENDLEVAAKPIKTLLTIFTNLKSLSFDGVDIGDDTTDWSNVAENVANLESIAVTDCGCFNLTAFESLLNDSKSLRGLKTNYLESYQTEQFENLESLCWEIADIDGILRLLGQHLKLKEIKCHFKCNLGNVEPLENFDDLLPSFGKLPFPRDVDQIR